MILDKIVASKGKYIKDTKTNIDALPDRKVLDFYSALSGDGMSIIAEVKKASPSKGIIREDFDHMRIAREYLKAGVNAMSVLTETEYFLGNPEYLKDIRKISNIPLLRKDFIIDEYQIYEAYLLGADAILLIAAILDDKQLLEFKQTADKLGLYCLTEVHDKTELDRVLSLGFNIIGINNRNLNNFEVNLKTTKELIRYIPNQIITVSESGIRGREDIEYLNGLGVDAVLIGETFMRADDICKAVGELR